MRRKTERKVLWYLLVIFIVLNVILVGSLAFVLVASSDSSIVSTFDSDPLIEQVASDATPSVVFIQVPRNATRSNPDPISTGTGVIVSSDGYIVTNDHVINGGTSISVRTSDKRVFSAELVGRDPGTDIAILKVDAAGLPALEFADSDAVEVGELAIAIGNPFGFDFTVTSGIISAKHRDRGPTEYRDFLQTDASINPGNSGGPLLNANGDVVGITTFIVSRERTGELGFAIPSNLVQAIMERLISEGTVERGYLGVSIADVRDIDDDGNGQLIDGARVAGLDPDGPAIEAGVEVDDLIVSIDDFMVEDSNQLRNHVAWIRPGSTVNLTVIRNETQISIPLEIVLRPSSFDF